MRNVLLLNNLSIRRVIGKWKVFWEWCLGRVCYVKIVEIGFCIEEKFYREIS